jgi:hypothetical protein
MVEIPKGVIPGAASVIVGLISFALMNPHIGSGMVALGVVWIMRSFRPRNRTPPPSA